MAVSRLQDDEGGGEEIISEINITPLTDVFLVLLIIFMVTSTALVQQALKVNLPRSEAGESVRETRRSEDAPRAASGGRRADHAPARDPGGG
jgi:biopolymer transport protein ExbD